MRTTFRIYAAVAAAALGLLASCQQQPIGTPEKDGLSGNELVPVTLTASIAQTKVTYEETVQKNLQPNWEVDDKVIGFDENSVKYEFTVSKVATDGSATLTGNAPANCTLHLIYLCGAGKDDITSGSLSVDYNGQAGNKTIPAVMLADGEVAFGSGNFHFHNGGAVIGINATKGVPGGSTISKITVYGDNLSAAAVALDGDGRLALTAGGGTGESISTGDGFSATVSSDGKGTLVGNPVLIAVPAGAKVSKISIVVGSDNYIYTLQSPVTLARNEYRYVLGKTFKSDKIPGVLSGIFTVSDPDGIPDSGDEKKVRFSQGNLYYDGSGFKFESNQYDYRTAAGYNSCIGGSISSNGTPSGNWGFFGWSTSTTNYGMSTSKDPADYSGDFVDWGQNAINESPANTWSTLSSEEWTYLIGHHAYKAVTVNGVAGMCLAPDGVLGDAIENSYADDAAWKAAENAGIVFLPAFGLRTGSDIVFDNTGHYWTSTPHPDVVMKNNYVYYVSIVYGGITGTASIPRDYGHAVRLVMDTEPDPVLTVVGVSQEDYVIGGAL